MPTVPQLDPVLGLPQHRSTAEELRILTLLTGTRRGLPFTTLAAAAPDPVVAYAALFALLTRKAVVAEELSDGTVGYRMRRRQRVGRNFQSVRHEGQLRLAA